MSTASEDCGDVENPKPGLPHFHNHYYYFRSKKKKTGDQMRFKRAACFDVGLECGGWGRIVMEIRVEERNRTVTK
jgi:hypothetical protein